MFPPAGESACRSSANQGIRIFGGSQQDRKALLKLRLRYIMGQVQDGMHPHVLRIAGPGFPDPTVNRTPGPKKTHSQPKYDRAHGNRH